MTTYDPQVLLQSADKHIVFVLIFGALTLISMFVCFGEALRLGFKHKTYAIPMTANMYYLAHDWTYVADAHKWFYEIGHWFPIFFWPALVLTSIFEALFLYQAIRYGRAELAPQLSQVSFAVLMILAQMGAFIMFWIFKWAMNDDLYFINFAVTITWLFPWSYALAVRRGSQRGQSQRMLMGALGLTIFFWITCAFLGPYFHSPIWIGLGVATVVWGLVSMWLLRKLPAYVSPEGSASKVLNAGIVPRI